MTELLHADLTYRLRGIGFQIHNALGGGHPEKNYDTALAIAFEAAGIPFLQQPTYLVHYRNQQVGKYRPDYTLANGAVQLDLKAAPAIQPIHQAQLLSYLAVTEAQLGFIMNFGASSMQFARFPNFLQERRREPPQFVPDHRLLHFDVSKSILDALYTVHSTLGPGFFHHIYRQATRIELSHVGLNATYFKELPLRYAGEVIDMRPTRLFFVEQKILLATDALRQVQAQHTEKFRWAMREVDCQLGLIANFYPSRLETRFLQIK